MYNTQGVITQQTQGGNSKKGSISDYVYNLQKKAERIKCGAMGEGELAALSKGILALLETTKGEPQQRLNRLFAFLELETATDEGDKLSQVCADWFVLVEKAKLPSEARTSFLRRVFDTIRNKELSVAAFVTIYNVVLEQCATMSMDEIWDVLGCVAETSNLCQPTTLRWRDCVVVMVKKLADGAPERCSPLVEEWLKVSPITRFTHIIAIAKECGLMHVVRLFVQNDLDEALSSFSSFDHDAQELWSLKALELSKTCVEESETILGMLMDCWGKDCIRPMLSSLTLIRTMNNDHVIKSIFHLLKSVRHRVISSSFGFLSCVVICGMDRHKSWMLDELKKTLSRIFRLADEMRTCTWMTPLFHDHIHVLQSHVDLFLSVSDAAPVWRLLCEPFVCVAYALLDLPSSHPVLFSDGRVSGGPRPWLFASSSLCSFLFVKPPDISLAPFLHTLIHNICSASDPKVSFVLIGVLADVVGERTMEVLNSWRSLERVLCVSGMNQEVAVALVRSLLPVFNLRTQLRNSLFTSMKKDVLCEWKASSATSILLLLLHSVTRTTSKNSQFSQSFATFSSQALTSMGCAVPTDSSLGVQIVSSLKRCLCQPAPTRRLLYDGIVEAAFRNPNIAEACMDLLLGQTDTVPPLNAASFTISTESLVELREPLPNLLHAILSLSRLLVTIEATTSDLLIENGTSVLVHWTGIVCGRDLNDLGIDKLADWSRNTMTGRSTLLFAHMFLSLCDVLIEFLVTRILVSPDDKDVDSVNLMLSRRKEVRSILDEKMVKRKEVKTQPTDQIVPIDTGEGIAPSPLILSQLLAALHDNRIPGSISRVPMLEWTVHMIVRVSASTAGALGKATATKAMMQIATRLLDMYLGTNCEEWIVELEVDESAKGEMLVAYAHIGCFLLSKYKQNLAKVMPVFQRDNKGSNSSVLMRHMHMLVTNIVPIIVASHNNSDSKELMERQMKALIQLCRSLFACVTHDKAPSSLFTFTVDKVLQKKDFGDGGILRLLLPLLSTAILRSRNDDDLVWRNMIRMLDQTLCCMKDEPMEDTFECVTPLTATCLVDFFVGVLHGEMDAIRAALSFAVFFGVSDMDECLVVVLSRCSLSLRLTSHLVPIHFDCGMCKEKIVSTLRSLFVTFELPVKMIIEYAKTHDISGWRSMQMLAEMVQRMNPLMARIDENIGLITQSAENRQTCKTKYQKAKKDEGMYVRFVKARESFQSRILLLSRQLGDLRLNLQVRNNAVGMRDFRIDVKMLNERMNRNEEPERDAPARKRRRQNQDDGQENTSINL